MFPVLQTFASDLSNALDMAIEETLNKAVGPEWQFELLEIEQDISYDVTKPGIRYIIRYEGRNIGMIRSIVTTQGNKMIGNIYAELEE